MSAKSKAINKLLPQSFDKYSNLPSLPPLFSCSACDAWRDRMLLEGQKATQRRDINAPESRVEWAQ
jgi:hypothetical protein